MRTVEEIIAETEVKYQLPFGSIKTKDRSLTVTKARHEAMALARQLTDLSYPEIADIFHRDHSVVVLAVKKFKKANKVHEEVYEEPGYRGVF